MNPKLVYSRMFNATYDTSKCVRVVNPSQMQFYLENDAMPKDIYITKNFKTDRDMVVMVFDRNETAELYKQWESNRKEVVTA